ncbi:Proline-serine-threonine phosphatase-interacting protein 2 [Apophysomyces sp. BC1015]|nr:Proline-serine-threonine phosphatase-interacting protein 2 [Apophysomyces sp. BC1015]
MMSSVYVVDDQACEQIRAALENVDVERDIDVFIEVHSTGTTIPEIPKYSSFVDETEEPLRTIYEINIPVMDEELRSVNDQLKKLPSRAGTMHKIVAPVPEIVSRSVAVHVPTPTDPDLSDDTALTSDLQRNKALPSVPQDGKMLKVKIYGLHGAGFLTSQMDHDLSEQDTPDYTQHASFPHHRNSSDFRSMIDHTQAMEKWDDPEGITQHDGRERSISFYESMIRQQTPANHVVWQRRAPLPSPNSDGLERVSVPQSSRKKAMFSFLKKKKKSRTADYEVERAPPNRRFSLGILSKKEPHTVSFLSQLGSPQSPTTPPFSSTAWQKMGTLRDGTPVIEYARALWNYEAKARKYIRVIESEISFAKNDTLAILEKKKDGWWHAEIVSGTDHGIRGLVPGNFMCTV